jgi:hypothetical protein
VLFGGVPVEALSVRDEAGLRVVDLRTPPHAVGVVDVELQNLDAAGDPVPGEVVVLAAPTGSRAHVPARPTSLASSGSTGELKRQVLANVSATVSVDYDDTTLDGLNVIAMAKVPSLVSRGRRCARTASTRRTSPTRTWWVASRARAVGRKPPYTVDLVFTLTAASERTAELFNLMAAVATFMNRNRGSSCSAIPPTRREAPSAGSSTPMASSVRSCGKDDVRAFTCGFVVRGFDVDEGLPLDLGKRVTEPELLPRRPSHRRCSVTVPSQHQRALPRFVLAHETTARRSASAAASRAGRRARARPVLTLASDVTAPRRHAVLPFPRSCAR